MKSLVSEAKTTQTKLVLDAVDSLHLYLCCCSTNSFPCAPPPVPLSPRALCPEVAAVTSLPTAGGIRVAGTGGCIDTITNGKAWIGLSGDRSGHAVNNLPPLPRQPRYTDYV